MQEREDKEDSGVHGQEHGWDCDLPSHYEVLRHEVDISGGKSELIGRPEETSTL